MPRRRQYIKGAMGGDVPALTVHRENKPSTVEPLLTVASDKIQQEKVDAYP